jgi:hypothetical protein
MLILRESIASIVLCFTCFVFSLFFFLSGILDGNNLCLLFILCVAKKDCYKSISIRVLGIYRL